MSAPKVTAAMVKDLAELDKLRAKCEQYDAVLFDLAKRAERAESTLCAWLGCTRDELTAGFEADS